MRKCTYNVCECVPFKQGLRHRSYTDSRKVMFTRGDVTGDVTKAELAGSQNYQTSRPARIYIHGWRESSLVITALGRRGEAVLTASLPEQDERGV